MAVLPFLEAVIYGVREVYNGATLLVRKSQLVFRNGLTAQVIGDQIVVDASVGGGGTVPIASGDASTETALDDFAVTGGRNLVVGSDPTLTNTYKFVTFVATDAIDWAVGGSDSTMSCNVAGATINNDRYLGFLLVADLATLPATGKVRFPYNGGAAAPLLVVKDSGGTDRQWLTFDTNTMTIGCAGLATVIVGNAKLDGMQLQGPSSVIPVADIDWSLAGVYTQTLANGATTFTFSNDTDGWLITVILTGDAGGSTVTWPAVAWAGGAPPTQTPTGTDVYTFVKAGTTIYGSVVADLS